MSRARADSDVFLAIADPTRRAILDMLREGEQTAGSLFESAGAATERMTQPAFSQHLAVLRRAGLVAADRRGSFRVYRLNPQPLAAVVDWASHYEKFWDEKLDRLGQYLEKRSEKRGNSERRSS